MCHNIYSSLCCILYFYFLCFYILYFASCFYLSDKYLNEGDGVRGRGLHHQRRHLLLRLQRLQVPRV